MSNPKNRPKWLVLCAVLATNTASVCGAKPENSPREVVSHFYMAYFVYLASIEERRTPEDAYRQEHAVTDPFFTPRFQEKLKRCAQQHELTEGCDGDVDPYTCSRKLPPGA